jgi:uncharacterized protein with GYD domain
MPDDPPENFRPTECTKQGRSIMPLYLYQAAYTPESWTAQLKNPQNRVEAVGRAACEAVGGKLVGGWYCFGEYDLMIIADVPNNQSMSAIALAIAAGGAIKASKTTVLMAGSEVVEAMKQADAVAKVYRPAGRNRRAASATLRPSTLAAAAATVRTSMPR